MDKFVVRGAVLILNAYMVLTSILAFFGIDTQIMDYLFATSMTTGVLLTVLCHVQGRYHCVWMRYLCYNLVYVPILNVLDAITGYLLDSLMFLIILVSVLSVNILLSMISAVCHYRRVNKLKRRMCNEYRKRHY